MFGLGMGELIVIAIVALLFVGPDKLPEAARTIGQGIRDFRRQTRDLQQTLEDDTEIGDAVRELKSALRGVDYRPRQMVANGIENLAAAAETGADAERSAGESDGNAEAGAGDRPEALPAGHGSPTEAGERKDSVAPDLPTLRRPAGSVPRGDPAGDAPPDGGAPAPPVPPANKPAHG